jgi:hypothetical protein
MTPPRSVADVLSTSGFGLTVHLDALDTPLHSRKPCSVFVNGMSDLSTPACPWHSSGSVFDIKATGGAPPSPILEAMPPLRGRHGSSAIRVRPAPAR